MLLEFSFVLLINYYLLTRFILTGYLIENFVNDWYSTQNRRQKVVNRGA